MKIFKMTAAISIWATCLLFLNACSSPAVNEEIRKRCDETVRCIRENGGIVTGYDQVLVLPQKVRFYFPQDDQGECKNAVEILQNLHEYTYTCGDIYESQGCVCVRVRWKNKLEYFYFNFGN